MIWFNVNYIIYRQGLMISSDYIRTLLGPSPQSQIVEKKEPAQKKVYNILLEKMNELKKGYKSLRDSTRNLKELIPASFSFDESKKEFKKELVSEYEYFHTTFHKNLKGEVDSLSSEVNNKIGKLKKKIELEKSKERKQEIVPDNNNLIQNESENLSFKNLQRQKKIDDLLENWNSLVFTHLKMYEKVILLKHTIQFIPLSYESVKMVKEIYENITDFKTSSKSSSFSLMNLFNKKDTKSIEDNLEKILKGITLDRQMISYLENCYLDFKEKIENFKPAFDGISKVLADNNDKNEAVKTYFENDQKLLTKYSRFSVRSSGYRKNLNNKITTEYDRITENASQINATLACLEFEKILLPIAHFLNDSYASIIPLLKNNGAAAKLAGIKFKFLNSLILEQFNEWSTQGLSFKDYIQKMSDQLHAISKRSNHPEFKNAENLLTQFNDLLLKINSSYNDLLKFFPDQKGSKDFFIKILRTSRLTFSKSAVERDELLNSMRLIYTKEDLEGLRKLLTLYSNERLKKLYEHLSNSEGNDILKV